MSQATHIWTFDIMVTGSKPAGPWVTTIGTQIECIPKHQLKPQLTLLSCWTYSENTSIPYWCCSSLKPPCWGGNAGKSVTFQPRLLAAPNPTERPPQTHSHTDTDSFSLTPPLPPCLTLFPVSPPLSFSLSEGRYRSGSTQNFQTFLAIFSYIYIYIIFFRC